MIILPCILIPPLNFLFSLPRPKKVRRRTQIFCFFKSYHTSTPCYNIKGRKEYILIMDSPPPNNNNNNNDDAALRAKEDALRPRGANNGGGVNENGDVEMFNLQDNGIVIVMFLVSMASWMLRERCTC